MLFCLFLYTFLLLSVRVSALPLYPRQAAGQPSSVTTVQTINSASGPVTQTCLIVLTPIKDDQGKDAVREVKTCTVSMAMPNPVGSGANSPSIPATPTPSLSPTPLPSSSPVPPPTSVSSNPASSNPVATVVTSSSVSTSSLPVPTSSSSSSSSAVPVSTSSSFVTTSASSVPTSASPVPTSVPTSVAPSSTPVAVKGTSSAQTAPTSVGVSQSKPSTTSINSVSGTAAAAEQASATNAAFTLPGKKLSVLPIGLGVFAGISVIALIVVGLVTYERTKYRKAFRQRKLAESGEPMGYGGSMV